MYGRCPPCVNCLYSTFTFMVGIYVCRVVSMKQYITHYNYETACIDVGY